MALLIVDPLSSARYLSESFRDLGIDTIVLYTANEFETPEERRGSPDLFDEQIHVNSRHAEDLLKAIGDRPIDFVLNGREASLAISDQLASALTPDYANDAVTSLTRMDKFRMTEAVAAAGLPHIRQRTIGDYDQDPSGAEFTSMTWPQFIRPRRGVGSLGASRLDSLDDLRAYLSRHDSSELFSLRADVADDNGSAFILSEFVEGTEYFVDTFSVQGHHFVSSIQRDRIEFIGGHPMMRHHEIETDPVIVSRIAEYIAGVLTAIGLDNGLAHTEIFLTPGAEPVLIEVNTRVSGAHGISNMCATLEGLPSQPDLVKAVVYDGVRDLVYKVPDRPRARVLCLFHFSSSPLPDLVSSLGDDPVVRLVVPMQEPGFVHAEPPASLADAVAVVLCCAEDPDALEAASDRILAQDLRGWD